MNDRGLWTLEAMAAAKPVLATRVGGICEIVEHMQNGLLVSPEDPEALADGIDTLLANPDLRTRLARSGAATVRTRFTLEAMGSAFESAFLFAAGR